MRSIQSAVSIWMHGPVDGEDIATLASLIQDFERELGIELRIDEPTRLGGKLLNAGTLVDLRCLLLDEHQDGVLEEPTWQFPAQPTTRYIPLGQREVTRTTVTRRIIPLKPRWPAPDQQTDHIHLFVRRGDGESKQTPIVEQDDMVEMVINLPEPASEVVVSHITGAIGQALPGCEVERLAEESPDEVYLQSLEEMRKGGPDRTGGGSENRSSNLTGWWFEEGLRAEQQLQLGPGTGPLPAMYYDDSGELPAVLDDWDADDSAWLTVSHTGGPRWVTFVFTVLVVLLGLSFLRTEGILEWLDRRVAQVAAVFDDDEPARTATPVRKRRAVRPTSEELPTRAEALQSGPRSCRWSPGGPVFEVRPEQRHP